MQALNLTRKKTALGQWTRLDDTRLREKLQLHGCKVDCCRCKESTWACKRTSVTLKGWHIEEYAGRIYCPVCRVSLGLTANWAAPVVKRKKIVERPTRMHGFFGVAYESLSGERETPWCASVYTVGHRKVRCGHFATPEEAAKAVDAKRAELGLEPVNYLASGERGVGIGDRA